ncbi:hypothetical protein GFC01_15435 [Desulfofundulus thermobenzoicus]|uniref:Uncharacterized protein n=1 Tax=Desulfofundulus thermobenzoicus TaxID=29376 RepID=A0A6N7IU90_9FIRM|nr:hypothetical protein [Desulfofundulus thermobenzoicus]MQL53630.1 hypothetical protein [Desulfofundulus thermobenzoicus]
MKINPFVYDHPGRYAAYYLEGTAYHELTCAVELLTKVAPQYTHEDVYKFLTDRTYRSQLLQVSQDTDLNNQWNSYEKEIPKKNWYKKAVGIVRRLVYLKDPEPIKADSKEWQIYNAVVNSKQYVIPVVYQKLMPEERPDRYDVLDKEILLFRFKTYGFRFISIPIAMMGNNVPYLEVELEYYHTYQKGLLEIYLPYDEMKNLYQAIFNKEYPKKYHYGKFHYNGLESI